MLCLNPNNAVKENIDQADYFLHEGQIAWHVLPYTTHTEFCGLEEFIRGMYFSRQLSEKYSKWPITAKMTDVPGHSWILPSLLYKAGVKFLHLGCNAGCMPPDVPLLFLWEGPDGNRILTFYSKGAYGSSMLPPADWPFPVWLALLQTNDNVGPQGPEIIEEVTAHIKEKIPDADIVFGTLDGFFTALKEYQMDNIPVIRGDLADSWIHGIGTYPREVSMLRELRHRLTDIEKALCLSSILDNLKEEKVEEFKEDIFKGYEYSLLFGEHTWGLDVKTVMGCFRHYDKKAFLKNKNSDIYKLMEKSWDEQRKRVTITGNIVEKTSQGILEAIASSVDAIGPRIIMFNGLGWTRDVWVELESDRDDLIGKVLFDTETSEKVEINEIHGKLHVYVKNLPALGYKTLCIERGIAPFRINGNPVFDIDAGTLENNWYRIEVDRDQGTIKSLVEKSRGKEWVNSFAKNGFGQYRYDIYGDEDITEYIRSYSYRFYDWLVNDLGRIGYPSQKHLTFIPSMFSIIGEIGNGYASIIMKTHINNESVKDYGNAEEISTEIRIYSNQPYIDISYSLKGKEETSYVEAGHFAFPINLKNPQIRINKLGSVIDSANDIIRDANHAVYCCENWVDITDGINGIAFIPYDMPLFSIGDQMIYKYQRQYEEVRPELYFNAFNNSWGTNFPQWLGGDYTFRYRIITHLGDWKQGNIEKKAFESVTPVLAAYSLDTKKEGRKLPLSYSMFNLTDGIEVLALKPAESNNGFVLRLRQIMGEERSVQVASAVRFKRVVKCDLLERIQEEVAVNTDLFTYKTLPYEVNSFFMEF